MKIRLSGTPDEVTRAVNLLRQVLHVQTVSRPYPNRRDETGTRVYIDAELPTQADRLAAAFGFDRAPKLTPEQERNLDAATHHAEAEAARIYGDRPAVSGERCTCGRPAVRVFTGGPFGDTGYCGRPDGGQQGPCPFCGEDRHESGRCAKYTLRPETR